MSSEAFIVFITGPACSGKSTIARAWADAQAATTACIDLDLVRQFVRSGRARPDLRWDAEAERQWNLAIVLCAQMARTYADHGIMPVIDAYAPPMRPDYWDELLVDVVVRRTILLPSWETCRRRNAKRVGEARIDEQALRGNYEGFASGVRELGLTDAIDNSDMTIDETVAAVSTAIAAA